MNRIIGIIFFTIMCLTGIHAHGDLHARILETTKEIEATPDSAYLYFKRGKLYYQHEDFQLSLDDLEKSKVLGNNDNYLLLYLSKANHKIGNYETALSHVEAILTNDDQNVLAYRIKGRILFDDKQFTLAAESFEQVIEMSIKTFPENYLDAAIAWELSGDSESLNKIYSVIEEGISSLGPIVTLYDHLIDVSLKFENYDKAILYQQKIIEKSNRKESPQFKMYRIYVEAGDLEMAKVHLQKAKEAYNQLPSRIKNSTAMKALVVDINESELKLQTSINH